LSIRQYIGLLAGLLFGTTLCAQNSFQSGILPAINLNRSINELYALNLKVETREQFRAGFVHTDPMRMHEHLLTDFTLIGSRKVGLSEKINLGYLLRLRQGERIHRIIQQFSFISRLRNFNLGHRLVSDQTFAPEEPAVFRLRYRMSMELPLDGEKADPGEFYVKVNNELIQTWQRSNAPLTEYRFGPFLGYFMSNTHKVEVGLDYRNQSILIAPTRHSYWLSLNWFFNL
tara:strand:- start:432 stop:1121 length:690 start_codon:yes stop_codon:yes gene_type:complete